MAIQDCVEYIQSVVSANITLTGYSVFPDASQKTGLFSVSFEDSGEYEARSADWAQSESGESGTGD